MSCVVYLSVSRQQCTSLYLDIPYEQFRHEIPLYVHIENVHMDKNKPLLNVSNINLLFLDISTRRSSSVI